MNAAVVFAAPGGPPAGSPVYNQAGYQLNAQYNVSSGTVKNTLNAGNIISASSVTASAFFGSGSSLTGVTGTDNTKVSKAGDTMTGALVMNPTSSDGVAVNPISNRWGLNVNTSGAVTGQDKGILITGNSSGGAHLLQIVDYLGASLIDIGQLAGPGLYSTANAQFDGSSVTASAFFGDGSHLSGLSDFGPSTATLSVRLDQVALSTTATSVQLNVVASDTTTIGIRLATVALATTTIASNLATTSASTQTLATNVAVDTTTLHTENVLAPRVDFSTITIALAGKQDVGNYITALTGGVTASGPGSVSAVVVTNANLTGPVTSIGNATTIVGPIPTGTVDLSTVNARFNMVADDTTTISVQLTSVASDTTTLHTESISTSRIDLSTVTVQFGAVATDTTTLGTRLIAVALATTTITSNISTLGTNIAADTTTLHTENVAVSRIDLSTVTTQFNSVATDTTTLGTRLAAVALATTTMSTLLSATSASTQTLATNVATDTTTIGTRLTSVALATTTINTLLSATSASTQTLATNVATDTTTLHTENVLAPRVDFSTITTALSGKQAVGNYITALTGGVTASGPGSVSATVVTNANLTGPVTSVGNATTIVGPIPTGTVDLSTVNARFNTVAADTTTIGSRLTSVAVDTTTLHTENIASSRINLSTVTTQFDSVATDTTTIGTRLTSVALATTTINTLLSATSASTQTIATNVASDTTTIGTRLTAVALATTTINTLLSATSASTQTLATNVASDTTTIGARLTAVALATTTINSNLSLTSASTQTLANAVALSTTSLGTLISATSASTQTLSVSVAAATTTIGTNLAATSASTQTLANAVASSTTTLFSVRASSGINNDITNLLKTVVIGAISMSGSSSTITTTSSVTASAFFGDGSSLTAVTGTDATKLAKAGDTMTGALTMTSAVLPTVTSTFTVANAAGGANPTWLARFFNTTNTNGPPTCLLLGQNNSTNALERNWGLCANNTAHGMFEFMNSASSSTLPSSTLMSIDSGGNVVSGASVTASGFFGTTLAIGGSSITATGALTMTPGAAITATNILLNSTNGTGATVRANNVSNHIVANMTQDGTNDAGILDLSSANALKIRLMANGASYVNNGANFGIGTASPDSKLTLSSGTFRCDGNTCAITSTGTYTGTGPNGNIVSASSITTTGGLFGGDLVTNTVHPTNDFVLTAATNKSVYLRPNGTGTLQVDTGSGGYFYAGNWGFGTQTPASKLHMSSGALTLDGSTQQIFFRGSANPLIQFYNGTGETGVMSQYYSLTSSFTAIRDVVNGTDRFTVTQPGFVSIGAGSNPATKLHMSSGTLTIDGTGAGIVSSGTVTINPINNSGLVITESDSNNNAVTLSASASRGSIGLYSSNTQKVMIDALGTSYFNNSSNFGLGTASPVSLLHMSSGTLTVDGTPGATTPSLRIVQGGAPATPDAGTLVEVSSVSNAYIHITAGTTGRAGIQFGDSGASSMGGIAYNNNTDGLEFSTNGNGLGAPSMKIASNGDATINGAAYIGAAATKSTFTSLGALTLASGAAFTTSGAAGVITTGSSVTASAFFGDGTALTGVTASAGNLTGPITSVGLATTIVGPVPQGAVNLSTVTTQFTSVASDTTTLRNNVATDTTTIGTRLTAVALATTTINTNLSATSASTQTIATNVASDTTTIGTRLTAVALATTTINTLLSATSASTETLANVRASTGTSIAFSTIQVTQDGALPGSFSNAPLLMTGRVSSWVQAVLQNTSNNANASSEYVVTNDLGGNTSFYLNIGINSSKYSNASFSAQASSAGYLSTSDSDLHVWAGTKGGINGAQNERIIFGSSTPVSGNVAMTISSNSVTFSTAIALNFPVVAQSSSVIGYWDRNISSRTIGAFEVVQASANISSGFTYGQAAATTTILGVLQTDTPVGAWGFIGTFGFSKVRNSAALCTRNQLVQAAAASPGSGVAQCSAAPAAGSILGRMLDQCAASAICWMFLRL